MKIKDGEIMMKNKWFKGQKVELFGMIDSPEFNGEVVEILFSQQKHVEAHVLRLANETPNLVGQVRFLPPLPKVILLFSSMQKNNPS